jgi:hypothetical protein
MREVSVMYLSFFILLIINVMVRPFVIPKDGTNWYSIRTLKKDYQTHPQRSLHSGGFCASLLTLIVLQLQNKILVGTVLS